MSDSEREYAFMLKAAFKKVFEGESSISAELVQEQGLYKGQPVNTVRALLAASCNLLRQAGFEGELKEETLKKSKLSPEQQDVFGRFWTSQKAAAQRILSDQSRLQNRLTSFEWRVDSKMVGETAEPTTVLEMTIADEKCHFELNAEQLQNMIASLSEVKTALEERSK